MTKQMLEILNIRIHVAVVPDAVEQYRWCTFVRIQAPKGINPALPPPGRRTFAPHKGNDRITY